MMERFEQNNSLSIEQQERQKRLAELSDKIKPLMTKLAETGLSSDADAIMEEVDRFKAVSKNGGEMMKKKDIEISDEQVRDFLKSIQGNS